MDTLTRNLAHADNQYRARYALENPMCTESQHIVLHLWKVGYLHDPAAWTIFYRLQTRKPYVKEIRWDRNYDEGRFRSRDAKRWQPEPTIRVREAMLNDVALQTVLSKGSKVRVPLMGFSDSTGGENTIYGIVKPMDGCNSYRLTWESNAPIQWKPLTDWYYDIMALLMQVLQPVRR